MKVLVRCEFSRIVARAFEKKGHDVTSCDFLPAEQPGKHYQGDVRDILYQEWDLGIFFPDCTYVCSSGIHWNKRVPGRSIKTAQALSFFNLLLNLHINKIAIENPIGVVNTRLRKPDQIIQPFQFGHAESKATCLWLKNLPPLGPTNILQKPERGYWDNQTPSGQNKLGPGIDRAKNRSRTYTGIADAMAEQWTIPFMDSS